MDSKSFAFGLFCGVVIGTLAAFLIGDSGGDEVSPRAENETNATSIPRVGPAAPLVELESNELPAESNPDGGDSQSSIEATVDPVAPWPDNLRAELQLEPKDVSWAYYMEQTLLQFLGAHSSIDQFDISSIECRTTKCQIEVFGYDESTVPVWQRVMYDIRQQPWSEFGEYGSSSGTVDGRLTIVGTLHRKVESESPKYSEIEKAQIQEVYELGAHLDELGVRWEDIEPNNLAFEAENYEDCLEKSKTYFVAKPDQAVAEAQCLFRYTPEWAKGTRAEPAE